MPHQGVALALFRSLAAKQYVDTHRCSYLFDIPFVSHRLPEHMTGNVLAPHCRFGLGLAFYGG